MSPRWPAFALALLTAGTVQAAAQETWRFRVLLDGDEIGRHVFEARGDGATRELVSQADFRVRLLFFDAFRYDHRATERWRGDCLESMRARTRQNGRVDTVEAARDGEGFVVRTPRGEQRLQGCVRSFAYWNPDILRGGPLLNAQTGESVPVSVTPLGRETLSVRGRPESTRRYRLSGPDIAIDLWYAGNGDWVALESRLPSGVLRYEIL
ncbi:MAG: hypothetical protein FD187_900 [bacterium]|nr:MAG: hypothetical protein FD142_31 [bacterium]KAF0149606.1 MAG: hypothetical protein FD187_900 [bacterium]KAF0169272.1 MAG: hypothetical protein FD158_462 [bacterium]TXT20645.1 MAG: hypothetical protein FD132_1126 [bacterium]